MAARLLVSIVDDDESIRESLPYLLEDLGYAVQAFSSAEGFLASEYLSRTDCLILDIAMPGMTGPELQTELTMRGLNIPIIVITAQGDAVPRLRMLQHGAVDCLLKPFGDAALDQALKRAFRTA